MSDEQKYQGEFFCVWCQSVIRTETMDYPPECPHCRMVRCEKCQTYLKGPAPKFCHGCGTIPPKVRPVIYRTSSTAGFYATESWAEEHTLGNEARKDPSAPYGYASGLNGAYLTRNRTFERIRDLTPEECEALGIKRQKSTTEAESS